MSYNSGELSFNQHVKIYVLDLVFVREYFSPVRAVSDPGAVDPFTKKGTLT